MPAKPKNTRAKKSSSKDRVRAYRERMRAAGMRQVTFWVPDTRTEEFKKEAHRQSAAAAKSPHAADDEAFWSAAADTSGWE